jgi:hypothetical protein
VHEPFQLFNERCPLSFCLTDIALVRFAGHSATFSRQVSAHSASFPFPQLCDHRPAHRLALLSEAVTCAIASGDRSSLIKRSSTTWSILLAETFLPLPTRYKAAFILVSFAVPLVAAGATRNPVGR